MANFKINVKYNRLSKYDFKREQRGYGNWLITYTYPKGRKISAVLTAISYDILNNEEPTQRQLKHIKDVIKHKNLTQIN